MIYYLVSRAGSDTMNTYSESWGPAAGSRLRIIRYDDLREMKRLGRGSYIFSDLERLSPPELQLARQTWESISKAVPRLRLFNDPSRVLCRYELLRRLFDLGKNRFQAARADEPLQALRFPVFIREENDHNGNLTPLLHGPSDLAWSLRSFKLRGYRLHDLLVVEFCDTSDRAGIFRKYSAFKIGTEILPRHLLFSRNWNLKKPDRVDPPFAKEHEAYLMENPHRAWLSEIFDLAGIEYGRIDYSMLGDLPQVWEINTNPTVRKLTPRLTSALEAIDDPAPPDAAIDLAIDRTLVRSIQTEERRQNRSRSYRATAERLYAIRWVQPLLRVAKRLLRPPAARE